MVRQAGGWFGSAGEAPDLPLDTDVLSEEALHQYVAALERTGFFGPDAYYMNHERNATYAKQARNGGKLDMPVLFLHGGYDYTCDGNLKEGTRCHTLCMFACKTRTRS